MNSPLGAAGGMTGEQRAGAGGSAPAGTNQCPGTEHPVEGTWAGWPAVDPPWAHLAIPMDGGRTAGRPADAIQVARTAKAAVPGIPAAANATEQQTRWRRYDATASSGHPATRGGRAGLARSWLTHAYLGRLCPVVNAREDGDLDQRSGVYCVEEGPRMKSRVDGPQPAIGNCQPRETNRTVPCSPSRVCGCRRTVGFPK